MRHYRTPGAKFKFRKMYAPAFNETSEKDGGQQYSPKGNEKGE